LGCRVLPGYLITQRFEQANKVGTSGCDLGVIGVNQTAGQTYLHQVIQPLRHN
jgi:hypothetical protein